MNLCYRFWIIPQYRAAPRHGPCVISDHRARAHLHNPSQLPLHSIAFSNQLLSLLHMAALRFDIISIGTLSRNLLWHETTPVRTPHATTTLVRAGDRNILVDPGLPGVVLAARLFERTGMRPEQIDTIFLTNFRPAHRAGLDQFGHARILICEHEQQASRQYLESILDDAPLADVDRRLMEDELAILNRCHPAPDKIADSVDLFPLYGFTPGTCGLLLTLPTVTIIVAGDAVATEEHFLAGQALPDAYDINASLESLGEVYEIADLVIPGHGNVFLNPRMRGF